MKRPIIYLFFLFCLNITVNAQGRAPAVENSIIIETAQGVQTQEFLAAASQNSPPMNALTLIGLLLIISTPFLIYWSIERNNLSKQKQTLKDNVIVMSKYQRHKKLLSEKESFQESSPDSSSKEAA